MNDEPDLKKDIFELIFLLICVVTFCWLSWTLVPVMHAWLIDQQRQMDYGNPIP